MHIEFSKTRAEDTETNRGHQNPKTQGGVIVLVGKSRQSISDGRGAPEEEIARAWVFLHHQGEVVSRTCGLLVLEQLVRLHAG